MNPTAIYSKSGKGVQEASGKTSLLKRPDRAVLSAIDGRATLADVAQKVGRTYDAAFQSLITALDKDGFIRAVSPGAGAAAPAAPSRPSQQSSPPSKPAAPSRPMDPGSDLDFSSLGGPSKSPPVTPQQAQQAKAQQSALDKAREDAEAKAAADRERLRADAEAKTRAEMESKLRAEAEKKLKEELEAKVRADAEAKVKAARDAAVRAAAEAKAKADADARAKLEAERKAREETERRLKEEAEHLRKQLEEAERKAREEAERLRKEAEEQARKLKEEAERVRKELEAERKRLEEQKKRAEAERAAERKQREEEETAAQAISSAAAQAIAAAAAAPAPRVEAKPEPRGEAKTEPRGEPKTEPRVEAKAAPAKKDSFSDSLMADLESFTNKDEEERKAREEIESKEKADAERRARVESERQAKEQAENLRRDEEEQSRKEEEKRKQRDEEERLAREEERRTREAEEIRRKAEAATAAAMAKQGAAADDDIPISDDDLGLDDVKKDKKALGITDKQEKEAKREADRQKREDEKRKREAEKKAAKAAKAAAAAPKPGYRPRRSGSWGKPVAIFLILVLAVAIGVAHIMPIDTADYERSASEALGQPVRIGSARLSLVTGLQLRFEDVRIGGVRIASVIAHPEIGAVFGDRKEFSSIELEGGTLPQQALGEALFAKVKSDGFSVGRIVAHQLALPGPLALPKLDAEITLDARGALRGAILHGPDGLVARLTPRDSRIEFDVTAAGFTLPIAPEVTLSQFGMKGTATRHGMNIAEWGGAILNGAISGTANLRWGSTWQIDGVMTVRGINAAVFAPALLSEGKAEGTAKFSMSSAEPTKLVSAGRIEGNFTVNMGVLGSFDLSRAIQSAGKTVTGRTQFAEMNGQAIYDRGSVALRNVTIGAGALNAGASADIAQNGALSGRIVADVRTASQTLRATLLLGGTVKEPQVRN